MSNFSIIHLVTNITFNTYDNLNSTILDYIGYGFCDNPSYGITSFTQPGIYKMDKEGDLLDVTSGEVIKNAKEVLDIQYSFVFS